MEQKDKISAKRACITCGREFDWDTTVCPDDNTPLTALGEEDQLVGTVLAERYEILEVIGGGGMGLVYKARHRLMNRIVAIKMLHKHMISSKDTLKRFQLEAQAASCLSLPNILTVYDFGLTSEGQPYMVMDYLEGTSLADLLEAEHHVQPERAVNIFIQACAGLAHAHQKGVLHRDIKPSNIMLVNFGDQTDFVKIVDFGIAKLLNQGVGELTKTGEVYGSPSYMSPEQCRGKETDARSDIYSMGCVMYRTLTGRPLFSGDDIIELLFKQVSEPPAPFDPELNIPHELETVIFKALAKDAADRYQNMNEFKEALEKYVEKRSGKVAAPAVVEGPMPLWKRHGETPAVPAAKAKSSVSNPVPETPAVAASAAASAPSSAAAAAVSSEPPVEAVRAAESKSRNADPPLPPKNRTAEAPAAALVTPPPASRDDNSSWPSGRSVSQTMPAPDTKHGASTHLRKKMAGGNKVLIATIGGVSAVALVIAGVVIFNATHPGSGGGEAGGSTSDESAAVHLSDTNAQAAFSSGRESFKSKKYDDAKIEFEEALAVTEKSSGMNSRELVPVLSELALVYRKLDKLPLAESSLKRAIPIQEHVGGKKDITLANLNFSLAQTFHEDGRPKDADVYGKKALLLTRTALGAQAPQVGEIQTFLSTNLPGGSGTIPAEPPPKTASTTTPPPAHPVTPEKPAVAVPNTQAATKDETPAAATKVEKPTSVASTATAPLSHPAAHVHRSKHSGGVHKPSTAPEPTPVRHRRAYSSYGF